MLSKVELTNFGPLKALEWSKLSRINLILGKNGSGKTFLLKAMYIVLKTLEGHSRGKEQRSLSEILSEKLYWTFQPDRIGDLVCKGESSSLKCKAIVDGKLFWFEFGKDTAKQINRIGSNLDARMSNSIFLPAKEVLSLHNIIIKAREIDKVFGFDDSYYDLAKALQIQRSRGRNYTAFASARNKLENVIDGKIEYDEGAGAWYFRDKSRQKFSIGVTAEGVKKISIIDALLGNRYIDNNSVVFIDEPESALHPEAISQFIDIISVLSECGIQFFLASHSYFVVKKLFLIAQQNQISVPVVMYSDDGWQQDDLLDGMPDNSIIDESIRLYEEEVDLAVR